MKILVLGKNDSGKSAYAEKIASNLATGELYYIATMIPYGNAGKLRIEKHRKQRESLGFKTIEESFCLSKISPSSDATLLLEDVSNLLNNVMFDGEKDGTTDSVFADIVSLSAKCQNTVMVSIGFLTAEDKYNEETRRYIDALNQLNEWLTNFADLVIEMHDGRPICVKGDCHALD